MDQQLKADWVEALRSGNYKQGRGELLDDVIETDVRHCAMGVLCEIDPEVERVPGFGYRYHGEMMEYQLHRNYLMDRDLDKADVTHVIIANDDRGKSFNEIADWIESRL